MADGGIHIPPPRLPGRCTFTERRDRWRSAPQRHYARHADLVPYAPVLLSAMFSRALRVIGPMQEYALRIGDSDRPTIKLMMDERATTPWFWYALDGSAEGRGLYELWAWRFGYAVSAAADEIWTLIRSQGDPPHG